jgi:transposase
MSNPTRPDAKRQSLREQGVLHRRAEAVSDALFTQLDFFDPRDLLQVKYEMLRRVETDGVPVSAAAAAFGLSRPSFYEARSAWERDGLAGLFPKKRGPHGGHKLTENVVAYVLHLAAANGARNATELAARVAAHFGVHVHPRSIERVLRRAEKKRR